MKYYIRESWSSGVAKKTAGGKARDDVEKILDNEGIKQVEVIFDVSKRNEEKMIGKIKTHIDAYQMWKSRLKNLNKGDTLFVQFPVRFHTIFFAKLIRRLEFKGVCVVVIVHDLEMLRYVKMPVYSFKASVRMSIEEKMVLRSCSKIIAHNERMKQYLCEIGIEESKIVLLKIFDYLIPDFDIKQVNDKNNDDAVVIAGYLGKNKAVYAYDLPDNYKFNLYGIDYDGKTNEKVKYMGSFLPNELPYVLNGKFGLVWDGESSETCKGVFGEYLRYNNPHKTSLYLASNIPVIIWKEAALADFVLENKCGIVVNSLWDIAGEISRLTDEDYEVLCKGASAVGAKMREGFYLREAVRQCV